MYMEPYSLSGRYEQLYKCLLIVPFPSDDSHTTDSEFVRTQVDERKQKVLLAD